MDACLTTTLSSGLWRALDGVRQFMKKRTASFLCHEMLSKGYSSVLQALVQQTFYSLLDAQHCMGHWGQQDNQAMLPVPRSIEPWVRQTAEPGTTEHVTCTRVGLSATREAHLFCQGPRSEYFHLHWSEIFDPHYLTQHRPFSSEREWLCSNKTLFTKIAGLWVMVCRPTCLRN